MTNDEYLKELMSRGDGSLQAWFDAEHVDNARSAKRAAAVERVRKAKDAGTSIGYAIVGREYYHWEAYETLIELLTDDGGLTNFEWLFIDSEQFRQAVSAFAFAHANKCPASLTQMVDWLMTEHVDAQSKTHSKTEPKLSERPESLSDANDGKYSNLRGAQADIVIYDEMPLYGWRENYRQDADQLECDESSDCESDSREKLEADVRKFVYGKGWFDDGIEPDSKPFIMEMFVGWLDRQAEITRKTKQAEWIKQANGLIYEANVRGDELQAKVDELRDEIAKRDKGIARLKRQRDEARQELKKHRWEYCETCEHAEQVDRLTRELEAAKSMEQFNESCADTSHYAFDMLKSEYDRLEAERDALRAANMALKADGDECVPRAIKKRDEVIKILKAERDALANDLQDCEQQRERLRRALGCAIDHAHEIVSLVNLDGEVIG